MFRRRHTQRAHTRMAAWLWPRSGWRRAVSYMMHRLSRLPGTPYSLAAGFACGAAASFTPLVGLHFVIAALSAWAMRANVLASIIGTAVGNPWTFPVIWLWLHSSGQWIMMQTGLITAAAAAAPRPAFHKVFAEMFHGIITGDWLHAAESAWPVIGPMLLAGAPTALIVWLAVFRIFKPVIERYQAARRRRQRRGAALRKKAARQTAKQTAAKQPAAAGKPSGERPEAA